MENEEKQQINILQIACMIFCYMMIILNFIKAVFGDFRLKMIIRDLERKFFDKYVLARPRSKVNSWLYSPYYLICGILHGYITYYICTIFCSINVHFLKSIF